MHPDEYRKLAETEDRMWYSRALNRRGLHWLDRLAPAGPLSVLDAGCGTGGFIRHVQAAGRPWEITGLDFSAQACALAGERTNARIVEGSILELPFANGEFDAVAALDVICQVEDGGKALREVARCVRPGGPVLVNVPAYRWLWSYHDNQCETKHRYTRGELQALCAAAGLRVMFATYANFATLPLLVGRRKIFRPRNPTSDVRLLPAPIEAVLRGITHIEQAWTGRGWPLPAGSSVFVAAIKER